MDREFVKEVVWNGSGTVATGPISSKTNFYSDDVPVAWLPELEFPTIQPGLCTTASLTAPFDVSGGVLS